MQAALRFVSSLEREVEVSKDEGLGAENLFQLIECVHSPYCQLLVRYPGIMETNSLRHKLHSVNLVSVCVCVCV